MKQTNTQTFLSEESLVVQLKGKSKGALEYLYDHYSASLYGVILKIVVREEIAQEVLQDTFIKVWEKADSYDSQKGRLFTWMLNIARNLAIDRIRSKEFSQFNKTNSGFQNVHIVDQNQGDTKTDGIGMDNVLNQLPAEQKLLIDMMYFKGFSQSEISKELDMPLGTIKTRVRSAMTKLRELLK
jgi:RNA polymerase sigma factor (sigma-70 family)